MPSKVLAVRDMTEEGLWAARGKCLKRLVALNEELQRRIFQRRIGMLKKTSTAIALILATAAPAFAWTATYSWAPSTGATSYKLEKSADNGSTWTVVNAAIATTSFAYTGTEPALVLFRVSACNSNGCTVRSGDGFWHDESKTPPASPSSLAVQ